MLAALFAVHAGLFYLAGRVPKLFFFYIESMNQKTLIMWKILLLLLFAAAVYFFAARIAFWVGVGLLVGLAVIVRNL